MSFDKFVLAVESRDLSQADKSIIRVSSFSKLSEGSRTSFSVSQQLRPEIESYSQSSQIYLSPEKLIKNVHFCKTLILD